MAGTKSCLRRPASCRVGHLGPAIQGKAHLRPRCFRGYDRRLFIQYARGISRDKRDHHHVQQWSRAAGNVATYQDKEEQGDVWRRVLGDLSVLPEAYVV